MKTKKGFIVKSTINGHVLFNHLLPNEFHLVKTIINDSDNGSAEVRKTMFLNENEFILQKF